ncbi:hypothetical protein HBB16_09180 [Pseudonocardia sp. MCCB 268]|nr:hypothetical protein [Pseudonocardia cytotoxica]
MRAELEKIAGDRPSSQVDKETWQQSTVGSVRPSVARTGPPRRRERRAGRVADARAASTVAGPDVHVRPGDPDRICTVSSTSDARRQRCCVSTRPQLAPRSRGYRGRPARAGEGQPGADGALRRRRPPAHAHFGVMPPVPSSRSRACSGTSAHYQRGSTIPRPASRSRWRSRRCSTSRMRCGRSRRCWTARWPDAARCGRRGGGIPGARPRRDLAPGVQRAVSGRSRRRTAGRYRGHTLEIRTCERSPGESEDPVMAALSAMLDQLSRSPTQTPTPPRRGDGGATDRPDRAAGESSVAVAAAQHARRSGSPAPR